MIKTVNVNVHKSNDNRKVSDEIQNIVKDSGEGRYFFVAGWCDGSCKKCCPEATGKRVG